jgi:hypothetical protein
VFHQLFAIDYICGAEFVKERFAANGFPLESVAGRTKVVCLKLLVVGRTKLMELSDSFCGSVFTCG